MSATILLADDSLTIQKVVELTFADTEYRVVAVSSGDELLDRMTSASPDLIICDVIMPGKDGYEVCQQIKSSPDWLHLPVILLTGTFEPFDRDRAIAAGCSEIITKPFEAQKLVDTVERLIGGAGPAAPGASSDIDPSFMSGAEEWPDEATPVEVPPEREPEAETFGTQLSAPAGADDDDGIEFTTSGFAEMEAAAESPRAPVAVEDGIDFEPGGDSADNEAVGVSEQLSPPPPAPEPVDEAAQTVRIDVSEFAAEPSEPEPAPSTAPGGDDRAAETVAEPFADAGEEPFEAPAEVATDEAPSTFEDESSMADTSPIDPPAEAAAPTEIVGGSGLELSDEDVDRIARRVIELASNRLDQIAWEIVPDMAEIVVRQRIRELEAEAESAAPDPVQ
jgi:CheY-like chemotaxis protein